MKKILLALVILVFSFSAVAEDKKPNFKTMSPQARKEFVEKKKAEWNKLNIDQKVEKIEKQRAERMAKIAEKMKADNEKWAAMGKQEKIEKYEKTMRMLEGRIEKMGVKKKGC